MSHQPEASVIVPVYNAEPYLAQCLGSIQRQTFHDFEVIIIDDGSTDRSERIYTDFVKMDDRFRVWKQPNRGVGKARKAGLEKARGRYIFWVDADDWAEPDLLDAAIKQFHEKNADICVWGWNSAEEIKKADFREKTLREWQESVLMGRGNTLWLFAAEKSLWKEIVFPENMNAGGEDGMCALELFLRAEKIAVYPAILYHHRNVVPDSVSHRISSHRYLDTMRLWKRRGGNCGKAVS